MNKIEITKENLDLGRGIKGGWTAKQVKVLGDDIKRKGWRDRVEGKIVTQEDFNQFLKLKELNSRVDGRIKKNKKKVEYLSLTCGMKPNRFNFVMENYMPIEDMSQAKKFYDHNILTNKDFLNIDIMVAKHKIAKGLSDKLDLACAEINRLRLELGLPLTEKFSEPLVINRNDEPSSKSLFENDRDNLKLNHKVKKGELQEFLKQKLDFKIELPLNQPIQQTLSKPRKVVVIKKDSSRLDK